MVQYTRCDKIELYLWPDYLTYSMGSTGWQYLQEWRMKSKVAMFNLDHLEGFGNSNVHILCHALSIIVGNRLKLLWGFSSGLYQLMLGISDQLYQTFLRALVVKQLRVQALQALKQHTDNLLESSTYVKSSKPQVSTPLWRSSIFSASC